MSSSGHFRIPNIVADEWIAVLGTDSYAVLSCLARHADENRVAFPSITRMQKMTGLSRPTVIKCLDRLEACNAATRTSTPGQPTKYTLHPPANWLTPFTSKGDLPVNALYQTSKTDLPVLVNGVSSTSKRRLPEQDSYNKTQFNKTQLTKKDSAPRAQNGPECGPKSEAVWQAYRAAYAQQYGTDPVRNAKVNANMCQLVDRLGPINAPKVAAWFLGHRGSWYVKELHSIGCLLRDCEKLHTEWVTGTRLHQRDVQEVDRLSADEAMWKRVEQRLEANKNDTH